jgi:transcriptional regulator with XRE-family HTH domain
MVVEGDLQRAVGRNLRAYREAEGLSQEAFAEVLGVHRTYMGALNAASAISL